MKKVDFQYVIKTDVAIQKKEIKCTKTKNINDVVVKYFKNNDNRYTNILYNNLDNVKEVFKGELGKFLKREHIDKKSKVLVVGLGNKSILSDSLGVRTLNYVVATGHLEKINAGIRKVYTFKPGVIGDTGVMTYRSVRAILKEVKADMVIVIDSLVCSDILYLNKLIQITDAGIIPGGGIVNYQKEIGKASLLVPVIAIGVPTATLASTIIKDALGLKTDNITFKKGYDLVVTSLDIDQVINKMSKILGEGINEVLHDN